MFARVGWWIRSWWEECPYNPDDIRCNPVCLRGLKIKKRRRPEGEAWERPSVECLKWNVDAAFNHSNGKAAIGGVLRDSEGMFRCIFHEQVEAKEINVAETFAILRAIHLSREKEEVWTRNITIESDSVNATTWSNGKEGGSWEAQMLLNKIRRLKASSGNVSIIQKNRESNGVADALAKIGLNRSSSFVVWL